MFRANPEFVRSTWLELTPQRLFVMPGVLALIFLVTYLSDAQSFGNVTGKISLLLFFVITAGWGAKQVHDSLASEFTQGTWDTQRLSGLSAWQMSVGKLFGGPVFSWYGGALCLLMYGYTQGRGAGAVETLRMLTGAIAIALGLHALTLLTLLSVWRKTRTLSQRQTRGATWILALLFLPQFLIPLTERRQFSEFSWYGLTLPWLDFVVFSVVLGALWLVLGVYRLMRAELQFRDAPWAWLAFLLYLMAYGGGWFYTSVAPSRLFSAHVENATPLMQHLVFSAFICGISTYLLLFYESKDWLQLRNLLGSLRARNLRRALEVMPLWLVSLLAALPVCAGFIAATALNAGIMDSIATAAGILNLLCFLVRDASIILALNFTQERKRADAAALLYLAVLYGLMPAICFAAKAELVLGLFVPFTAFSQPPWLIMGLLQAALALDFLRSRWRKLGLN